MPHDGELRVWYQPHLPGPPLHVPARSLGHARAILEGLSDLDLRLLVEGLTHDETCTCGLEVFNEGQWREWKSAEGKSIWATMGG